MAKVVKKKKRGLKGLRSAGAAAQDSNLRPSFVEKTPPCTTGCPNHNAIREMLMAISRAEDLEKSHEQAFAEVFYPAVGYAEERLWPVIDEFYATEFRKLRSLTQPIREARSLVEWAMSHGLQVVIATNPVFPRVAIEERLEWAGIPASEFEYALVTSYEVMHSVKPNPAYYREIVHRLARQPEECLMVGDDWERDILPAASVGIPVYWIAEPDSEPRSAGIELAGHGKLPQLWTWLKDGGLDR